MEFVNEFKVDFKFFIHIKRKLKNVPRLNFQRLKSNKENINCLKIKLWT